MPRWLIILLSLVGLLVVAGYVFVRTVGPSRLGFDMVYDCLDTSGVHAVSMDWYFHINLHPPEVSEKRQFPLTVTDTEFRWDGNSIGHNFSGFINRVNGQWEERIDHQLFHSGTCKRIH